MANGFPRHFGEFLVGTSLVCAACGGDGTDIQPDVVSSVEIVSGDHQAGRVGVVLADPIVVRVTSDGNAAPGVTVNWSTTAPGDQVIPAVTATDADGMASASWVLGTEVGAHTAQAAVSGATGSPVTFSAGALAAAAAALAKASRTSGDNQVGEINSPLVAPLQAQVTDGFGNPVPGVDVNWTASGAAVSAPTALSDEAGISEMGVTLGSTAGPITVTAAANGLAGSPLTFIATATEPATIPAAANVTVRNNSFLSVRNSTSNPAVDTVAVGGTITWTWAPTATNPHDVTSTGSPGFTGQATLVQPPPFSVTFSAAGAYDYYCTVHGQPASGMRGTIVVR